MGQKIPNSLKLILPLPLPLQEVATSPLLLSAPPLARKASPSEEGGRGERESEVGRERERGREGVGRVFFLENMYLCTK